jgi:hypothetical protein
VPTSRALSPLISVLCGALSSLTLCRTLLSHCTSLPLPLIFTGITSVSALAAGSNPGTAEPRDLHPPALATGQPGDWRSLWGPEHAHCSRADPCCKLICSLPHSVPPIRPDCPVSRLDLQPLIFGCGLLDYRRAFPGSEFSRSRLRSCS